MIINDLKKYLLGYFDISNDIADQEEAHKAIVDGVSFKGVNILILIIAIVIASLGLNTNSAAVIIGAMLISPLMGPIMGMGLGVGIYDFDLIKRSFRNIAMAAAFSVLASTIYFLISPVSEGRSELLARTSPTIYDVFIGFFGGLAGIFAVASKQKGNVLPGVAIATALMPPLCTAGYGLATWQLQYFFGAFYLFLINSIFIAFSTTIGVKFMKFKPKTFIDEAKKKKIKSIVYIIITATLLPSVWLTFLMLRDSFFISNANKFINTEFVFPNTQVFSKNAWVKNGERHISVTLIGEELNTDSLKVAMQQKMTKDNLGNVVLDINQGFAMQKGKNPALNMNELSSTMFNDIYNSSQEKISRQTVKIDSLQKITRHIENMNLIAKDIAPEVKVLFPVIKDLALTQNVLCNMETGKLDTVNVALVHYTNTFPPAQQRKFIEYLEARSRLKDIQMVRSSSMFQFK